MSSGISISGWTEGNYTASTAHHSNLPMTFNDRANFWQMNQNFLRIAKSIDTSKQEFQMGGLAELILPGTDARFSAARGLLDKWGGDYRIDLFQAYIETFHPNLGPQGTSIKTGKFATLVGYELVQAAETPFLSRSYVFQYDPFTHTGALATTPLNDTWSVSNGLALGSDNFIGAPPRSTYLGQLKWAPKKRERTPCSTSSSPIRPSTSPATSRFTTPTTRSSPTRSTTSSAACWTRRVPHGRRAERRHRVVVRCGRLRDL